jgi:hypothetical protein
MTCQATTCGWRQCAGCGRERRLSRGGAVLCDHNRWDPASGGMVRCEGSGQEPGPYGGQLVFWCATCPLAVQAADLHVEYQSPGLVRRAG